MNLPPGVGTSVSMLSLGLIDRKRPSSTSPEIYGDEISERLFKKHMKASRALEYFKCAFGFELGLSKVHVLAEESSYIVEPNGSDFELFTTSSPGSCNSCNFAFRISPAVADQTVDVCLSKIIQGMFSQFNMIDRWSRNLPSIAFGYSKTRVFFGFPPVFLVSGCFCLDKFEQLLLHLLQQRGSYSLLMSQGTNIVLFRNLFSLSSMFLMSPDPA